MTFIKQPEAKILFNNIEVRKLQTLAKGLIEHEYYLPQTNTNYKKTEKTNKYNN